MNTPTRIVGVTMSQDAVDQLQAAFDAVGAEEGYNCIGDLLAEAVQKEILRLQRCYNSGNPWLAKAAD
ncbi:hypothetical protein [Arthrobacter sp. GMC3]|uniref:hypothetical protein n=1 Tax=Arthrobacter sp. GMC3 TaxID=2058894 RepID=UPI000CE300F4|nr:hypothetical protein [Arthrobacter sp. GMC3]